MSLLLPLIYLGVGILLGRVRYPLKQWLSAALINVLVPIVIIDNISSNFVGIVSVTVSGVVVMTLLLWLHSKINPDPMSNLCFGYLNIGWLGLPIAGALFGEQAAFLMTAIYISNTIFGNTIGVRWIQPQKAPLLTASELRRLLMMLPIAAFVVGLMLVPLGDQVEALLLPIYPAVKVLMSFCGLAILGIWLSQSSIRWADVGQSAKLLLLRVVLVGSLMTCCVVVAMLLGLTIENKLLWSLYFIPLLPPAAYIVVLETCYLGSGKSAGMIAAGTLVSGVAIVAYIIAYSSLYVL